MKRKTDFLVIGSGIAGLSYALKVAPYGKVCVITKSDIIETATKYAQGGIAAVTNEPDSYEKHISDTLTCGDGLCDEKIVRMVVTEAPKQIDDLVKWGIDFDRNQQGEFDLAKEGGHSEHRVLHHKDNTGYEIQRALSSEVYKHPNIEVIEHCFAIDLITQHHLGKIVRKENTDTECYGAYVLHLKTNKIETILARITMIATGGCGNVYFTTTNPELSTGDGVAMVHRARGVIENMEFVQFHPTSLYNPWERPSFLITEALRGFGAILKTTESKEFMHRYDKRGSLAPRDIVARAIDNEMKISGADYVFLDARHCDAEKLKNHFPNIYSKCLELDIDITKQMIPVVPAAHYACGGIKVDEFGQSSIKYLYAIGEASCTGLHGANRLASNSLLEAVVFADRASRNSIELLKHSRFIDDIPDWNDEGTKHPEEMILITQNLKEMQQIMTNYVGIVRSDLRLKRALDRLEIIWRETEQLYKKTTLSLSLCQLRNLISVGYLIIKMAMSRKESRGLHFSLDFQERFRIQK